MKITKTELKKLITESLSESTAQSSLMDIASAVGREIPGFVETLDLYYTADGIIGEYLHEDGKAYQVYIKEKKAKTGSPTQNLSQFNPMETLPKYRMNENIDGYLQENKKLKDALENMLKTAENKLKYAIDRNKEWDIEHYKNDIEIIKKQLSDIHDKSIFNNEKYSQADAIAYLKSELSPIVPFINITSGALGSESIMLLISFEPKEEWTNGYVENSNYIRMRIEQSGVMEVFTKSLYKKGTRASYENRLNVKFRKVTAKSLEDAKNKAVKLIEIVKEQYV